MFVLKTHGHFGRFVFGKKEGNKKLEENILQKRCFLAQSESSDY